MEQNNIHLEWSLPSGTRSEALDLDTLKALSKANLRYLVYAPESGSAECLTNIKKKIKLSKKSIIKIEDLFSKDLELFYSIK